MLTALQARSSLQGFSINLEWTWLGPGSRPALVLLRRTRAHPQFSNRLLPLEKLDNDGLQVIDLEQTFGSSSDTWAGIRRELLLGRNTSVESNLQLAEFSQFFRAPAQPAVDDTLLPQRIVIGFHHPVTKLYTIVELNDITLVNYTEPDSVDWTRIQHWEIYHAPGGGPAEPAGEITISSGHRDGTTADRFAWQPHGGSPVTINFDRQAQHHTDVLLEEGINPDSGDWNRRVRLVDRGLQAEEVYYYRLYLKQGSSFYLTKYHWVTEAIATGDYDFSSALYKKLPAVHQYYDEQTPDRQGKGQLRRYLSLAGASLDHSRSLLEFLRQRHNTNRVYSKALPGLARMIGWRPDVTSDAMLLRKDISDAPAIYRTVGTVANLRSVVNRVTGWDCQIKEFVHNIFLTNAVENINLWEIWHQYHDGSDWSAPAFLTTTDGLDGHPQVITDSGTRNWLFWHADRNDVRSLWRQQLDAGLPVAKALVLRSAEERTSKEDIEEYPAVVTEGDRVWLFWASQRHGQWNIWGSWSRSEQPFSTGPDSSETIQSNPQNLSDHPAEDRHPMAIRDDSGAIRVFWQSNRRGPTDIWCRTYQASSWGLPERITTAELRHLNPSAVVDGDGRIWLFYAKDLGNKINLELTIYIGGGWTGPYPITDGLQRDETPSAAFWNGQVHLFWHSNRNQKWQVYYQTMKWTGMGPTLAGTPQAITTEATDDKEPFARVDSATNQLHLYWRSQRRGRDYRSRSIDTGDPKMIAELRTFQDRAHYTYDTGKKEDDYYARDTVGVFLTPNPEKPDLDDRNRRLFNGPLKEFIPINIRPVLFILPEVYKEYVYTYDFPGVDPQRVIGEDYSRTSTRITDEIYTGLDDSYTDTIDDWTWLRTWSPSITDHRTVDTTTPPPIDIHFRTWHVGVSEGA